VTQDSPGVPGAAEVRDAFGASLATGDYGRSRRDDLAVGAPGERLGTFAQAGVVDVLYGRLSGISGTDAQVWSQGSPGVKGSIARLDRFGFALTP
jgi:hypothetical protein